MLEKSISAHSKSFFIVHSKSFFIVSQLEPIARPTKSDSGKRSVKSIYKVTTDLRMFVDIVDIGD